MAYTGNKLELNDKSGFSGIPGGCRTSSGGFSNIGLIGYWWSSIEGSLQYALGRSLDYNYTDLAPNPFDKHYGFSVRCVRDNQTI